MPEESEKRIPAPLSAGPRRMAIGAKLREARIEAGLRLADVADGIVSVGYLSMIEQGQRTPAASVLAELAQRVGLAADDLRHISDEALKVQDVCRLQDAVWATFVEYSAETEVSLREMAMVPSAVQIDARLSWALILLRNQRVGDALDTVLDLMRDPAFDSMPSWHAAFQVLAGSVLLHSGDDQLATAHLAEALEVLQEQSHLSVLRPFALLFLARAKVRAGDVQAAARLLEELEPTIERSLTVPQLLAPAREWWSQRERCLATGDDIGAVRFGERAIALGYEAWRANTHVLMMLELIAFRLRFGPPMELEVCDAQIRRLRASLTPADLPSVCSGVLLTAAEIALTRGDCDEAEKLVSELQSMTDSPDRAWAEMVLSRADVCRGNHDDAVAHLDRVRELVAEGLAEVVRTEQIVEPWEALARAYSAVGRHESAWECMRLAMRGAGAMEAATCVHPPVTRAAAAGMETATTRLGAADESVEAQARDLR